MRTMKLGSSDLVVPVIAIGCGNIGYLQDAMQSGWLKRH